MTADAVVPKQNPDAPARSVPSLAPFNLRDREVIRAAFRHVVGVIRGNRALHDGPLTTTEIGALSEEEREIIREARTDRALRLGLLPYGSPSKPKLDPQPSSDGLASLKAKIEALRDDVIEDMEYPDLILRPEHEGQLAALDAVLALLESPSSPEP